MSGNSPFAGRNVLISGGCGFIGSMLARRLVSLDARVTLIDSLIPSYGGNLANIADIRERVWLNISDVRDPYAMSQLIRDQHYLFNLAGQTSHIDSMTDPFTDLNINATAQLSILEAARRLNPAVRIVYASTRQIYGKPEYLPVDEKHPVVPVDINGIHKLAGENYHLLYHRVYGIPSTCLRLTNTYGPGMRVKDARQTFLGIWLKLTLSGQQIKVFGDGKQLRDFNYVEDAVDALLLSATRDEAVGQVMNLGSDEVINLADLAQLLVTVNKSGSWELVPFPPDRKAIDIGDYYGNWSRARELLGWQPKVSLAEGLGRSLDYYRANGRGLLGVMVSTVAMNDFRSEPEDLVQAQLAACERVLRSGWWILGQEVAAFEKEWAAWLGVPEAVGCGNGLDAIEIGLRALGVGTGDEVITTPMTAFASVLAIIRAGATPVLADIDPDTGMLSPGSVKRCCGPRTRAVVLVHLYGQIGPVDELQQLARARSMHLIEDCAQAHGATLRGQSAGSFGAFAAWSFYPTKNLGAIGDGGALTSMRAEIATSARSLRNYGQSVRYHHPLLGMNSRLDELQAAILRERLKHLSSWVERRRAIATRYASNIASPSVRVLPLPHDRSRHAHHLFVVTCARRDELQKHLKEHGVESLIHYPIPVHFQEPCREIKRDPQGLAQSESHAAACLSLPCHPALSNESADRVIAAVNSFGG